MVAGSYLGIKEGQRWKQSSAKELKFTSIPSLLHKLVDVIVLLLFCVLCVCVCVCVFGCVCLCGRVVVNACACVGDIFYWLIF